VVWKRDLVEDLGVELPEWGLNGSVHVENGLAVLNAGSHGIALDAKTGAIVWQSGKGAAGYATPTPFTHADKRLLAIFGAEHLIAVEPATGQEAWRLPWKTRYDVNASDPVIHGPTLFISSGYGTGASAYDLSENPPKNLWINKSIRAQMASCIAMDGHVYGVDGQGGDKNSRLKCIDIRTGEIRWESPVAETGNLAAVGNTLLWLTGTGEIVLVEADPKEYREKRRAQISGGKHWSVPVLADGRLYVKNAAGDLVCVETRSDEVR
jgi:outer membrane protein assembly factor BamB